MKKKNKQNKGEKIKKKKKRFGKKRYVLYKRNNLGLSE